MGIDLGELLRRSQGDIERFARMIQQRNARRKQAETDHLTAEQMAGLSHAYTMHFPIPSPYRKPRMTVYATALREDVLLAVPQQVRQRFRAFLSQNNVRHEDFLAQFSTRREFRGYFTALYLRLQRIDAEHRKNIPAVRDEYRLSLNLLYNYFRRFKDYLTMSYGRKRKP
ncbi:hypothetical protein HY491_03410 [Candidatus Woesearchaeota archaeon]|nr:hypothetical protein [Candidatus Woesearchaeota archaeon]